MSVAKFSLNARVTHGKRTQIGGQTDRWQNDICLNLNIPNLNESNISDHVPVVLMWLIIWVVMRGFFSGVFLFTKTDASRR